MFTYFPTPIADELPYSMLARYRHNLRIAGSGPVLDEAFGDRLAFPTTTPASLRLFSKVAFGPSLHPRSLVRRHTPYPYLSAFLPVAARARLMSQMLDGGRAVAARHGATGTTRHAFLAFCPDCVELDLRDHGQAAWRRTHQLAGVFVCADHGCPLRLGSARSRTDQLVVCPDGPSAGEPLLSPLTPEISLSPRPPTP